MNKKFRFISAAATALLAVAPVATSAIAPVATTFAATEPDAGDAIEVSVDPTTVAGSTKDANENPVGGTLVDGYLKPAAGSVNPSVGTAIVGSATLADTTDTADTPKAGDQFIGGHTYTQTITYALAGLKPNGDYTINGKAEKASANGIIDGLSVSRTIYATDPTNSTQPYFTTESGTQVIDNGLITPVSTDTGYTATGYAVLTTGVKSLSDLASAVLTDAPTHAVKPTTADTILTTTRADIASQLSLQGVSVDAKGNVVSPSGFVITLTAENTTSGKSVSARVPYAPVKATADVSGYPIITAKTGAKGVSEPSQGANEKADATYVVPVPLGATDFDPIKTVSATATTGDKKANLTISIVSNPVNVAVPGKYTVVLAATDWTTGKTTQLSYTVQVGDATGTFAQVQYVPGYSVVEWKVLGNTVSLAGAKASDGTTVETFDTTTIGGVSYTRVGSKDANTWIQTQYLDGSWKAAQPKPAQPTTPAAAETKVSGVATVTYKGAGKVRLVNSNGKYVSQYVSKGSHWKVFAKKTIKGSLYYRLGSQSQWVPAKYVSVK